MEHLESSNKMPHRLLIAIPSKPIAFSMRFGQAHVLASIRVSISVHLFAGYVANRRRDCRRR